MTSNDAAHSPLYLSLLAETAKIGWPELERFFARGILLHVARDLDLVSVAEAIASDDTAQVTQWLSAGLVERMPPPISPRAIQTFGPWWSRRGFACRNAVESSLGMSTEW
jgi:hypothetical protein